LLAWPYESYGTDPAVVDLRYGILPVIIAIVAHAVYGLGRTALNSAINAVVASGALAAYLLGVHELLVLVVAGVIAAAWAQRHRFGLAGHALAGLLLPIGMADPGTATAPISLAQLFVVFLEIGSVLYGSGYVLLAFLQRNLVDQYGWLTTRQLLDAVAVGQITPGPLFTTATFVGWQIDGPAGAAVATIGIFLPSFVFVAFLGRIVPWVRARPTARAFLDGVTGASLGLMAAVAIELTGSAIVDVVTGTVAAIALGALVVSKVSPTWLIAAGVAVGIVHSIA